MGIQAQTRPVQFSTSNPDEVSRPGMETEGPNEIATREGHTHPFSRVVLADFAATSNVAPTGVKTVDGETTFDDAYVLLPVQTDPNENGLYRASDSGAWEWLSVVSISALVQVALGTEHADSYWVIPGLTTPFYPQKFWQSGSPLFTPYTNHGNTTGAVTIESRDGAVQRFVLTGNLTVTLDAAVAPDKAQALTLFLVQDGTGSRTVTWPASVRWDSGTAPTLSTGANDVDIIQLLSYDGGTTWFGFEGGLDFAVPA